MSDSTIIAKSSANGIGAISIIRLSGNNSIDLVSKFFKSKSGKLLTSVRTQTIHYGKIYEKNEIIDEVLVSVFKKPNSYTGENVVEISCHGSVYIEKRILELFINNGVKLAIEGEFTLRAFLNKKINLIQAEAVADLISSKSKAAHQIAFNQMRGGYAAEIAFLRQKLLDFASLINLELDFSEEDVVFADRSLLIKLLDELIIKINSLITSFQYGNVIKHGVPVAIVGIPNAGKSSLLNSLLNEDRAIVSSIPGTTRDTIEENINIKGIDFRLIDTAGIRKTSDIIEKEGLKKANERVKKAKILIYLFDQNDFKPSHINDVLLNFYRKDLIIVIAENKIDLKRKIKSSHLETNLRNEISQSIKYTFTRISAIDKKSVNKFKELIYSCMNDIQPHVGDSVVSNSRHYYSLKNALQSIKKTKEGIKNKLSEDLLSIDIKESLNFLGEITGEITNDEILGNIFSNFCIGK